MRSIRGCRHARRARRGDRRKRAVLLALRRSGLALLAHARGRAVWTRTTRPRSAALAQRPLFAAARGRRMFGTLQKRLPQEIISRSRGAQRLPPDPRPSWLLPAARGHPLRPGGPRRRGRQHRALGTARCRSRPIATATTTSRRRSGSRPDGHLPSSTDPGVWRATAPTAKPSTTTGSRPRDPLRRDRARALD